VYSTGQVDAKLVIADTLQLIHKDGPLSTEEEAQGRPKDLCASSRRSSTKSSLKLSLVTRRHITREPEEYTTRTVPSEASQALAEAGIVLTPGETVEYVVVDATGKRRPEKAKPLALYALEDGYDIDHYTELALKAVERLLLPFGYDLEKLSAEFDPAPEALDAAEAPAPPTGATVYESLMKRCVGLKT